MNKSNLSRQSVTFPVTITKQAHQMLTASANSLGLKNAEISRLILYHFLMEQRDDFLPELRSEKYNKNHVVKKTIYLPEDYWAFLRHVGYPSLYIFYAIKEKRERDKRKRRTKLKA